MPEFVQPCLATLAREPPTGPQWVHEIKLDGYRLQARLEKGDARIITRNGLDWTHRFRSMAATLAKLPVRSALIDGEAIVEDERGVSSFVALVDELKAGGSTRIAYVAFDLLHLNGVPLAGLPLRERKSRLEMLLRSQATEGLLRYSQHLEGDGTAILAQACKLGLEGIVSKRIDKPYQSGRSETWLKTKCIQTDEFVVIGYVDSTAIRNAIGALALGFYDGGRLTYAGRVGTGFDRRTAADLWSLLQPLRLNAPPLDAPLTALQRRGLVWVKPQLVAQVEYRAVTGDRLLRHASFVALREDKPAKQVEAPGPFRND
jgi:bifunctional non-homologous end joining protein LigD